MFKFLEFFWLTITEKCVLLQNGRQPICCHEVKLTFTDGDADNGSGRPASEHSADGDGNDRFVFTPPGFGP